MKRIEAFAEARSQFEDGDVASSLKQLEMSCRNNPELAAWLNAEASVEEVEKIKSSLNVVGKFLENASPEEAKKLLVSLGISDAQWAKANSSNASFKLRTKMEKHQPPMRHTGHAFINREMFIKLGLRMWPHSFAHCDQDDITAAHHLIWTHLKEAGREEEQLFYETEDGQFMWLQCARWAHYGFPLIQLSSHKYAAALMATVVPQDIPIEVPWKTFLIEVPLGLLHTTDESDPKNEPQPIAYVLVARHIVNRPDGDSFEGWTFKAFTSNGISLWRHRMSTEQMTGEPVPEDIKFPDAFSVDTNKQDDRVLLLLSRLILSVCLAMNDPDRVKKIGDHSSSDTPGSSRYSKEPTCRIYRVGKPIELDCRPALYAYLSGAKRSALTVQFLVRGHYRWQTCGPRSTQRRSIWIEPHWKGPEDAAIVVRPHKL